MDSESKITKKEVEHVAKLARLGLQDEEKDKFTKDLSDILDYVAQLKGLDVEKVEPVTGSSVVPKNVFRHDENQELADGKMKSDILNAAPAREGDFFKVPSILD